MPRLSADSVIQSKSELGFEYQMRAHVERAQPMKQFPIKNTPNIVVRNKIQEDSGRLLDLGKMSG